MFSLKRVPGWGGRGTPYNVLYGDQAPPERGTFFSLQDFSLLDVNENGREISHCRLWKDLKELTGRFYSCVRDTKTFWLSDLLIFKRQNINYHLKGVTFANNRYKVIPFLSKILLRTPPSSERVKLPQDWLATTTCMVTYFIVLSTPIWLLQNRKLL